MPLNRSGRSCMLYVAVAIGASLNTRVASAQSSGNNPPPQAHQDRPPVQGSTVGYIDDAIVGSQVRIRFDSVFGDSQVDLAEFLFAESGFTGGAGPKSGLASDLDFQQLYLRGEYAPKKYLSFLVDVPVRFVEPQSFNPLTLTSGAAPYGDSGGLSDVSAGLKWAALAGEREYVTFQFVGTFPSGKAGRSLGTDHYTFAPSVLYYQKLTDRFTLEGEFGDSHPIGGDTPGFAGDVLEYGAGPSFVAYKSNKVQFTPVVELVIWRIFGGNWSDPTDCTVADQCAATPTLPANAPSDFVDPAGGSNIVNVKFGGRANFRKNSSIYVGYGHTLTIANFWYQQILRVEYRRAF